MVTWTGNPPERPAPGTVPRSPWSRFMPAAGRQDAAAPAGCARKLPEDQAQALAAQAEAEQQLTDLAAEGVPEDDPRFMEAQADYRDACAMVPLGPDSVAYVAFQKGTAVSAYATEPEAN